MRPLSSLSLLSTLGVCLQLSLLPLLLLLLISGAQPAHAGRDAYPSLAPYPVFSTRKIALLHMHDGAPFFLKLGSLTLANKARYASRHGYELVYCLPEATLGVFGRTDCTGDERTDVLSGETMSHDALDSVIRAPAGQLHSGEKEECLQRDGDFQIDARAPTFGKIKLTLATCRTRPGYWVLWTDADAMVVNQTLPLEYIIDDRYDIILSADWLMINAGMIIFKCSPWTTRFLERVYGAREFDDARALDQSAFQHFFDTEPDIKDHLKMIPKRWINVYTEEYQPGDFLLHMAGKLYEATTAGATAVAHQYDMLSMVDDIEDIRAFFHGRYMLNMYSGTCDISKNNSECPPEDPRRIQLREPLIAMSYPNRYRHVGLRYYWLKEWKDEHDKPDWRDGSVQFDPSGRLGQESRQECDGRDETCKLHDEL